MNFGYTCKKICGGHPSLFTRSHHDPSLHVSRVINLVHVSRRRRARRGMKAYGLHQPTFSRRHVAGITAARRCFTCIRDSSTHGGASTPATLQSQARHRHASWMRDWSSRGTHVSVAHTSRSLASFTRESCLSTRARCFARAPA